MSAALEVTHVPGTSAAPTEVAIHRPGAQRMGFPYALVGPDPGAHFQSLAEVMHSRRPPEGSEPRSNDRLRRLEFYGEPYLGPLQAPKSNSDGAG